MLIFVSIFGVGFVILLLSMIFGHDGDVGGDVDSGGDVGDHGPSIFSIKMLSLILVGFGAAGFGVRATTETSMFVASMGGIGGSVLMGVVGYIILRAFYRSQASSTIVDQDVVGGTGNLIDGIPENGRGQVACIVRGREMVYLARSKGGRPIVRGTAVRIVGKTAGIVTVESVE